MDCNLVYLILFSSLYLDLSESASVTTLAFTAAVDCSDLDLRCRFTTGTTETKLYLTWKNPSGQLIYKMDFQSNNYTFEPKYTFGISKNNLGDITFPKANVNKNMAGRYTCTVRTNVTTSSSTQTILVQYGPTSVSVSKTSPPNTVENSNLVLSCNYAPSNPAPSSFKWTGPSNIVAPNRVLTVASVSRTAAGTYTCTATTTLRPSRGSTCNVVKTASLNVQVFYHDIPTISISDSTPKEGSTFSITCRTRSAPAVTLSASRNNVAIKSPYFTFTKSTTTNRVVYSLQNAKCAYTGSYKCKSINAKIGTKYSPTKAVNVLCKPRISTRSQETLTLEINELARCRITVIAYPPPSYSWFHLDSAGNRLSLKANAVVSSIGLVSELSINITSVEDYGIYTVVANNSQGETTVGTFTLRSDVKPFKIERFQIVNTSADNIFMQWLSPFDGGHQQTFTVQFASERDYTRQIWSTRHENFTDPGRYQNVTGGIFDLHPGRTYFIRIVSSNSQGSITSSVIDAKTEVIPGDQNGSTGVGIGIGIAICACIALVGFTAWCVYRYRTRPVSNKDGNSAEQVYANNATIVDQQTARPSGSGESQNNNEQNSPSEPAVNATDAGNVIYQPLSANRTDTKSYEKIALKPKPELGPFHKKTKDEKNQDSNYENYKPNKPNTQDESFYINLR